MKTFKDLEFKSHAMCETSKCDFKQAKMKFDNGKEVSVLLGKVFYSNGIDTYEAWDLSEKEGPLGYLTENEVTEYMLKLQKLKD